VQPLQSTEKDYRRLGHDITALLVHDHGEHLARFEKSLRLHLVELTHARTCQEASQAIQQDSPPLLIFTDTRLSDGTFQDILKLAAEAEEFVNVLVVSRVGSTTLYMEAREHGGLTSSPPTSNHPASPYLSLCRSRCHGPALPAVAGKPGARSRVDPQLPKLFHRTPKVRRALVS
jgi:CheY-like chemotaxis protein